jgi:alkanesulfonate monooxygenase SsuD/methylene tetrahydromethanopterin reductase-like flavin-dependent oxidoreductase (luciferase family)
VTTLKFGLGVSTTPAADVDPVAEARAAEAAGFDFVSASDHLHGTTATYEPWTLLAWIAASTSRIRVATRVLAVPYRHPAVVAKMAESLDRLSGGRLILGLGGGYLDAEFRAFGLPVPSPRDKIDGLEEAIGIVRDLWARSDVTFGGRIYSVEAATIEPKPEHRIPIWLGAYRPRGLALTGRLADGWIPSYGFAPPDEVTVLRDRVMAAARESGRDPAEIAAVYNIVVRVQEAPGADPAIVAGPAGAVADRLIDLLKIGFSGFNLMPSGPDRLEQIELLGRDVIPAVRAAAG